jgi:hypothetical protein
MRKTRGWIGARLAVVAIVFAIGVAPRAWSSPVSVNDYATAGAIDSSGISGPNVITFNNVAGGQYTSPSGFSLGEFVVSALPADSTTTYTNTPFSLTYLAQKVNGGIPTVNETPLVITGKLNGAVTGSGQSSVVATFDPVQPDPTFRTGDFVNTLTVPNSFLLVPSSTNNGRTTIQSTITSSFNPLPVPAPEPATIAVFVMAGVGLGLRRHLRPKAA